MNRFLFIIDDNTLSQQSDLTSKLWETQKITMTLRLKELKKLYEG